MKIERITGARVAKDLYAFSSLYCGVQMTPGQIEVAKRIQDDGIRDATKPRHIGKSSLRRMDRGGYEEVVPL